MARLETNQTADTHHAPKLHRHYRLVAFGDADNVHYEELLLHKKQLTHVLLTLGQLRCIKPKLYEAQEKKLTYPLPLLTVNTALIFQYAFHLQHHYKH